MRTCYERCLGIGRCGLAAVRLWSCEHGSMDRVVIGRGSRTATFRDAVGAAGDAPYEGEGSFIIELRAEGLHAERTVFVFSFDWENLVAFFEDLAESWRGWDGEKTWNSIEHDLAITATSDPGRHCSLLLTVRGGPHSTWEAAMGGLEVDSGEDLAALARSMRAWALE